MMEIDGKKVDLRAKTVQELQIYFEGSIKYLRKIEARLSTIQSYAGWILVTVILTSVCLLIK